MKPALFNTEMVKAILDGRKTATRRVVKLKYRNTHLTMRTDKYGTRLIELQNEEPGVTTVRNPDGTTSHKLLAAIEKTPPYCPGDILYVRETWCLNRFGYHYRADDNDQWISCDDVWRPSIHMPKEAARLFGRATGIKAQRVQDITDEESRREGAADREDFRLVWTRCYAKPRPVKGENGEIDHYESYPWEDIHETRTYRGKPWYVIGNPWVWVIEFERVTKEVAEDG